jgi:hypothetical protein
MKKAATVNAGDRAKSRRSAELRMIGLEMRGDIAYITINRPEAMNAKT